MTLFAAYNSNTGERLTVVEAYNLGEALVKVAMQISLGNAVHVERIG